MSEKDPISRFMNSPTKAELKKLKFEIGQVVSPKRHFGADFYVIRTDPETGDEVKVVVKTAIVIGAESGSLFIHGANMYLLRAELETGEKRNFSVYESWIKSAA